MAFTVFPDGAKGVIDFDWNGEAVSIVLHFEKESPPAGSFPALAAEIAAKFASEFMPNLTDELTMGDVTVYDLSAEGAPKYVNSDEDGTAGTLAADSVPNNTAGIISHRTDATGRSGRGRTYIPGLSEADESNGILLGAPRDAMLVDWATIITAIDALGWLFVVAQRFSSGTQLATGVMRLVTSEIMKRQLGTQRRRQVQTAL